MPLALKRFLLSLFVAGLTFWMSLEATYTANCKIVTQHYSTRAGRTRTLSLRQTAKYIEEFRKQAGHLPENLREVETRLDFSKYDRETWARDGWKRPLAYQRKGECFSLISYGHDGKPGGIGLDADIVYGEKKIKNMPTFWQFLRYSDSDTNFLYPACWIAAFFAFFVGMYASYTDARERKKVSSVEMLLSVALVAGISVFGAVLIGALDYPSGH